MMVIQRQDDFGRNIIVQHYINDGQTMTHDELMMLGRIIID